MNIPPFLRAWQARSTVFATAFLLVVALPVHSQDTPAAPPAGEGAERETIEFEGMRIVFPKGEADVVEQLKPALRKYREERRRAVDAEAREMAELFSGTEKREMFRKPVAGYMARDSVSKEFDARWASLSATMRTVANASRAWSGDLSELQLWRREELAPFQTRPDGSDNEEGFCYRFPQVSFGKNGAHFALHPPFLVPLFGVDIMLKLNGLTNPMRLDIPLLYKPGETPEEIASYGRKFLEELPPFIHKEHGATGFGLVAALPRWALENLFRGEIEATVVEHRTSQETALADGIARILLFAQVLSQDGQQKVAEEFPKLFPFAMGGWDISDPEPVFRTLEKLDPLGKVERANVTERIFSRNLIALALLQIGQKDAAAPPILHKFKQAGVAIPEGGFTMDSFCAAVDTAYGEKNLFRSAVAASKTKALDELRQSVARHKEEIAKRNETPAAKTPAPPAPPPNRESARFGGLTITYPAELKAAVQIVGPEYAKLLAKARASMEVLCKKSPGAATVNEADVNADMAALRTYGIEPAANVIREFAMLTDVMRDGTQLSRWFFSGDRMQVWIKEDMLSFLKGGGKLPEFSLDPDGEHVTWNFGFSLSKQTPGDPKSAAASPSETRENVVKRIDAIPRPEYPIILKRNSLPGSLDDPTAVAAAIRAGDEKIFKAVREAAETPETASRNSAIFGQLFNQEQAWFLVAHEVTEFAIVNTVIKSADRRWFCDGMANWVAMQDVDRRFGPGKGAEAFAKSYPAAELRKEAAKVDLLAWPTEEDIKNGSRPNVENVPAYYYFATLVMQKACEGRGADFIQQWLDEIRKTPLNRANAGTVLAAYQKLTGQDLKSIIGQMVKAG
jgi:hypothetical protein